MVSNYRDRNDHVVRLVFLVCLNNQHQMLERPLASEVTYFASGGESAGTRSGTSPCLGIGMWPLRAVPGILDLISTHGGWTLSVHCHCLTLVNVWDYFRAQQQRHHRGKALLWGLHGRWGEKRATRGKRERTNTDGERGEIRLGTACTRGSHLYVSYWSVCD